MLGFGVLAVGKIDRQHSRIILPAPVLYKKMAMIENKSQTTNRTPPKEAACDPKVVIL